MSRELLYTRVELFEWDDDTPQSEVLHKIASWAHDNEYLIQSINYNNDFNNDTLQQRFMVVVESP